MLILLLFTCHVSLLSWSIFTFFLTYYLLLFILWPLFFLVTNTFFVILQISILLPYQIPYWNRLSFGFLSFWRCKGSTVCAHSKEFLRFFPISYLFLDMRQSDEFKGIWLLCWRGWVIHSINKYMWFVFVPLPFGECRTKKSPSYSSRADGDWRTYSYI